MVTTMTTSLGISDDITPHAGSYQDGAVNRKLAEIAEEIDPARRRQHASGAIVRFVQRYRGNHRQLRIDAIAACRAISRWADGPVPEYVQSLLGSQEHRGDR